MRTSLALKKKTDTVSTLTQDENDETQIVRIRRKNKGIETSKKC